MLLALILGSVLIALVLALILGVVLIILVLAALVVLSVILILSLVLIIHNVSSTFDCGRAAKYQVSIKKAETGSCLFSEP